MLIYLAMYYSEIEKAGERILDSAKELFPENMKVIPVYRTGDPAEIIKDYEHEISADLIVMGSRGLGLVRGVLLGSVRSIRIRACQMPSFDSKINNKKE